MKKTILLFTLALSILLLVSCSSYYEEHIDNIMERSVPLTRSSESSSIDDMGYNIDFQLLTKYLRLSGKSKRQHNVTPLVADGEVLAYCVQYDDGWDIISGDKRCAPVMITSDSGICNISDQDIQGLLDYIKGVRSSNSRDIIPIWRFLSSEQGDGDSVLLTKGGGSESYTIGMWRAIDTILVDEVTEIPHIIQSHWSQGSPWNKFAPYINGNQVSIGSLAVAAGQIIHHYRKNNHQNVAFPTFALPGIDSTDFSTDVNPNYKDALRWATMPLDSNGVNTDHVATMLVYLEQEVLGFGYESVTPSYYIDSITNPFPWGKLYCSIYNGYDFDGIYYGLLNGSPACVCSSVGYSLYSYIIDRYRRTDTYYEITCIWDPDYIVSEEEYYANDPQMFIESASGDEKTFTKSLITYTYWGMNWGMDDSSYDNRFYLSRSYNAGGMDDAGYFPSSVYVNPPYWDMSLGKTRTVNRIYCRFRNM